MAPRLLDAAGMRTWILSLVLAAAACATDRPTEEVPGDGPDAGSRVDLDWVPGLTATALATDANHLYIGTGPALSRVPLAGGSPEPLYTAPASPQTANVITKLVVGPSDVVFVQTSLDTSTGAQTLSLYRLPLSGGVPTMLASSSDSRSYLGMTIAGTDVIYSTFTALYRVPLAGGPSKFIAQSPRSIRYWIFSPAVLGGNLVWAEGAELFSIPMTRTGAGVSIATLPGTGAIIGGDATKLVVALSTSIANQEGATSFVEIDPTTGAAARDPIPFGHVTEQAVATSSDVWAASFDGLVRAPRDGSAPEIVITDPTFVVAASSDAVFTATNAGIARITK